MMIQDTQRRPTLRRTRPTPQPAGQDASRNGSVRRLLRGFLTRRFQVILLVSVVAVSALSYFLVPSVQTGTRHALEVVGSGDEARIGDYFQSFGVWGPVISLLLMVGQAIIAPIPGTLVIFANGVAFGTFWGTVLSVVGQTLAAMVCFWIARVVGRGPVEKMVGRFGLESLDRWVGRWGALGIVLLRLVPGVAFDGVSYGAGLLRITFRVFVVATVLGVIPQSLFYTWMIQRYPSLTIALSIIAVVIFAGTALVGVIGGVLRRGRTASPPSADG